MPYLTHYARGLVFRALGGMSRVGASDEVDAIPLVSPRAQTFPDLDGAVSRLEKHITMNSDASTSGEPQGHSWNAYNLPESRYRSSSPSVKDWDLSRMGPGEEEDLAEDSSRSEHAASTRETPWQRMRIVPKGGPIDPFTDSAGYGAIPIGKDVPLSPPLDEVPVDQHDHQAPHPEPRLHQYPSNVSDQNQDAYRQQYINSYQYPQATSSTFSTSSSYDYDPEAYAMYSTPDKMHSHPRNSLPISRSPTPNVTPTHPSLPSAVTSRLTRRILSSKENTPKRPNAYIMKDEEDYEVENHVSAAPPSPVVDSSTMHFGLPPRKQRRRHQEGRKLVPLTQCVKLHLIRLHDS